VSLFNRISTGQIIPHGFFARTEPHHREFGLLLPVWIWRGKFYDISRDEMRYGWKVMSVLFRFMPQSQVLDLRVGRGWWMLKEL